jgi:SAM-dependent methyltransferase
MTTATQTIVKPDQPSAAVAPDLGTLKTRQKAGWSSGDYAVIGTTLQIVGEELCEALDLRSGQKVLDVAAGNGNVTLAAARRWCDVVSTDYVPSLLERGAGLERRPMALLSNSGRLTPNRFRSSTARSTRSSRPSA